MVELRIDTSKDQRVTVALLDGARVLAQASAAAAFHGTEKVLPLVAKLLRGRPRPTKVTVVADAHGNAGFTQLRAGVVAGNALGYAWNVPVASVPSGGGSARGSKLASGRTWVRPRYHSDPKVTAKRR